MNILDKDMAALRESAINYEWYHCEIAAAKLCKRLNIHDLIKLALQQVADQLPIFEHYHPNVTGPRDFMIQMAESGRTETSFSIYHDAYQLRSPGGYGFFQAMGLLRDAAERIHKTDICFALACGAIGEAIKAGREEYWATQYPEDWYKWKYKDFEDIFEMQTKWMGLDVPDVNKYESTRWLSLANVLEQFLYEDQPSQVVIPEYKMDLSENRLKVVALLLRTQKYSPETHLNSMKKAVATPKRIHQERFDWAAIQLFKLYLGPSASISIALSLTQQYLPQFEHYHPKCRLAAYSTQSISWISAKF